jgi:ADP-ribosylglycohydrolase/tetratricopeptide (TPR) repeat protein
VPGDAIWLVTLTDDRELMLVGRLIVGEVIEYEEAVRRMPDADLWQAEYYALPAENTAEVLQPVSLSQNLTKLRFGDPDADRFYPVDGRLNPQQLQDLRTLTPESGDLLADLWLNREIYRDPVQNLEERRAEVQNNPNDPEAHYKLALTYCDLEMIDEAVESYQKAIELDPRWLPAHFNLGIISLNRDHLNEAEEHFQAVIDLDPQAADAYFTLGVVYGRGGKPEDSIYVSKLGLQIEPESPLGHFNIGGGYFLLENFSEALKWTKKACDLGYDPEYTTYLIGKCYRHLDRPDDERAAYAHALELAGDFIDGHFALGTVWARVHGGEAGSTVPYVEVGNEIDLENPAQMYMFLLGCLAQGQLGTARELAAQLWQSDELLGSRADHFIDLAAQQEWPEEVRRDTDEDRIEPIDEKEVTESEQPAVTKPERRTRTEIRLMVDGEEVSAKNLPDLYLETLKMLVDKQILDSLELPIASGRKRNIISREPLHKDSSRFFAPVEYGGFFMEAHNSRENGIRQLQQFLANLGIQSSLVTEIGSSVSIPAPVDSRDRFLGSMLGLAVCDALGTTGEFKPTGSFPEINSIVGGGPFNLLPGEWTDDTSMALCLAESLIDCHGFDAKNQMERYLRWYKDGHLSSNGRAFDIGITIRAALDKFDRQVGAKNPFCGSVSPSAAGNGSLMRLAPVALYFAGDPTRSIEWAAESSKTTHGAKECIDACRYFAGLISGALQGRSKEEILSASFSPIDGIWQSDPLADRIAEVANGAFKSKKRPKISSTGQGYVALSLHAALWAFYNTASFKDGAIKVVNLGYDADTYGAIYGQLAGAFYGVNSIPTEWLGVLAQRETIERFAQELFEASGQSNTF